MRISLAILLVSILCSYTMQIKKKKVIFFGDSITQAGVGPGGYITKLDSMLRKKGLHENFEVAGAGIGGNKIYDLYLRMDEDVIQKKPDMVVIWVGVNDVWHKRTHGTGTDPDKFERFYNAVIKKFKAAGIEPILCTPAAIGEKTDFTNELDGDLNRYSAMIRKIAGDNQCRLIDLRKEFLQYNLEHNKDNVEAGILTNDRVHLNDKGNLFVAEKMLQALTAKK